MSPEGTCMDLNYLSSCAIVLVEQCVCFFLVVITARLLLVCYLLVLARLLPLGRLPLSHRRAVARVGVARMAQDRGTDNTKWGYAATDQLQLALPLSNKTWSQRLNFGHSPYK